MGNEFRDQKAHSAEYLGDARDHWWNDDFVELLARRWQIAGVRAVLDVGCGIGHWSRVLGRVMPRDACFVGVDREPSWIEEATRRAAEAGASERFTYRVGAAELLPFDDNTFDVVTCQTLLIHVPDPDRVLAEMVRVTRPGGLVVAAEPTNVVGPLVESIALGESPASTASLLSLLLVCQRGKKALGEGDALIGESLAPLFLRAGLERIEIRQNDRCAWMVAPYVQPFQPAEADEARDADARDIGVWDEATTRGYFLAGGGSEGEFVARWEIALTHRRRLAASIASGHYACAAGSLFYLAWGWRGN